MTGAGAGPVGAEVLTVPIISRRIAVGGLVIIALACIGAGTISHLATGVWPHQLSVVLATAVGAIAGITIPLRDSRNDPNYRD